MIKVISGPVKAGKSKKLIEIYKQLENCGVMVFSSKFSLNHGEDVVSRYGTKIKAIPINSMFDIPHHIPKNKSIFHILVDEFQFLQMSTGELKAFFDEYYFKYDFYIFGLNRDYRKSPFKLMASAMAMADKVELLGGYCDLCGQVPSKHSLRLENNIPAEIDKEGQVILLDGEYNEIKIDYKSICDDCWKKIYINGRLERE